MDADRSLGDRREAGVERGVHAVGDEPTGVEQTVITLRPIRGDDGDNRRPEERVAVELGRSTAGTVGSPDAETPVGRGARGAPARQGDAGVSVQSEAG